MSEAPWRRAVAELARLASAGGRRELNAFSVEGLRLVERALRAGAELAWVVVAQSILDAPSRREGELLDALGQHGVPVHATPNDAVTRLVEGRTYGALLARVARPPEPALADLTRVPGATLLAAVDVDDPGNTGALVRTALASGARAFVAVGHTDPFHPKAVRTSMGSLFKLPVRAHESFTAFADDCAAARVVTVAAVTRDAPLLPTAELEPPLAFVVGSEAAGLSGAARARADARVTIPMIPGVDSLSVNAAAAVLLYELARRRAATMPAAE